MRRAIPAPILFFLLFCANPAFAQKAKAGRAKKAQQAVVISVGQVIDLSMRKETPNFVRADLELMDRDKLVYVGKGMWQEQDRFVLRQLEDSRELVLQAPLADFLKAHPDLFPGAKDTGFPNIYVERLLFLDREDGRAGIHLIDKTKKISRHYYLGWDLANNTIDQIESLGTRDRDGEVRLLTISPIGYRPTPRELILQVEAWKNSPSGARLFEQRLLAIGSKATRELATWTTARSASRQFAEPKGKRALIAEYAELGEPEPSPLGHLLDLDTGERRSIAVPMTTYGAAFSPDGQEITLYSNQLKLLRRVELKSGKTLKEVKVGGGGHALAWGPAGRLMLLAHRGLTFLDPQKLTRQQFFPSSKVFSGQIWLPGSLLCERQAIMRNGDELVIVQLRRREQER